MSKSKNPTRSRHCAAEKRKEISRRLGNRGHRDEGHQHLPDTPDHHPSLNENQIKRTQSKSAKPVCESVMPEYETPNPSEAKKDEILIVCTIFLLAIIFIVMLFLACREVVMKITERVINLPVEPPHS